MAYRNEFFQSHLPLLKKKLPVADGDGREIGIYFTIFDGVMAQEYDTDAPAFYAKSVSYAYKQLVTYTDILETGIVRIFVEKSCEDQVIPIFENIGITPIIRFFDTQETRDGCTHIVYRTKFVFDAELKQCDYIFSMDDDMWFIPPEEEVPKFSWSEFTNRHDEKEDGLIAAFGTTDEWFWGVRNYLKEYDFERFNEIAEKIVIGETKFPGGAVFGFRNSVALEKFENFFHQYHQYTRHDEAFLYAFVEHENIPRAYMDISTFVLSWLSIGPSSKTSLLNVGRSPMGFSVFETLTWPWVRYQIEK